MFRVLDSHLEKVGRISGFIAAYIFFTFSLYIVLSLTKKLPPSWNLLHTSFITFIVTAVGLMLRKKLD